MTASFDIKDLAGIGKHIEGWVEERVKRGILSTAIRLVSHIQTDVIPQTQPEPSDNGMYKAAWQYQPTADGADVYNTVPYAPIIEFGAKAENIKIGRAMIDALTKWIIRKGLVGGTDTRASGKVSKRSQTDMETEARQIAWAIAKKMQQQGIFNKGEGLKVLARASEKIPMFLQEEIAREMER